MPFNGKEHISANIVINDDSPEQINTIKYLKYEVSYTVTRPGSKITRFQQFTGQMNPQN